MYKFTNDSAGTVTSTSIIGSNITGSAFKKAYLNEYFVAILKALEEESTTWVAPSFKEYLKLTTGYPVYRPFFTQSKNAFSTAVIYSCGTDVPTTSFLNSLSKDETS